MRGRGVPGLRAVPPAGPGEHRPGRRRPARRPAGDRASARGRARRRRSGASSTGTTPCSAAGWRPPAARCVAAWSSRRGWTSPAGGAAGGPGPRLHAGGRPARGSPGSPESGGGGAQGAPAAARGPRAAWPPPARSCSSWTSRPQRGPAVRVRRLPAVPRADAGRASLLISHRFSTVRMADGPRCWSTAGSSRRAATASWSHAGAPTPPCTRRRGRPVPVGERMPCRDAPAGGAIPSGRLLRSRGAPTARGRGPTRGEAQSDGRLARRTRRG